MIRSAGFALAVVITCSKWNGVRTCSSPNGYVSHESTWNGITTGDDNRGGKDIVALAGHRDDDRGRKMIPRKPKLDPRIREDIALYSTDDPRHLYHTGRTEVFRLDDVKAEIRWRVWCEEWIFSLLTLLAAVIGAAAAIIAAVEGWPHTK
jgi:hypothetical protein